MIIVLEVMSFMHLIFITLIVGSDAGIGGSKHTKEKGTAASTYKNVGTLNEELPRASTSASSRYEESIPGSSSMDFESISENREARAPAPSKSEIAETVSLAPLDAPTEYEIGSVTLLTDFTLHYRRKICNSVNEFLKLPNADFDNYIFDAHLYEFRYPNGDSTFSIAIHCPTISYPQLFLRVPADVGDLKVVTVPTEEHSADRYIYSLATSPSITLVPQAEIEDEAVTELKKNPIFNLPPTKLWEFCQAAQRRFKYGLLMNLKRGLVDEPTTYEVEFRNGTNGLYGGIKCPASPIMYLLFTNLNQEIKITFLDKIEYWLEHGLLRRRPKLMHILSV